MTPDLQTSEPASSGTEIDVEASPPDGSSAPGTNRLQTFFLGGLFIFATLAALRYASAIVLPVVVAMMLKLLLQPVVRFFQLARLPASLAALVVILFAVGSLAGVVAALSVPASSWAAKLPEGVPRLEARLMALKSPIQALQNLIQATERIASSPSPDALVVSTQPDLGLAGALMAGTQAVADGLLTMIIVLYFLLASSDVFLRRLVEVLPRFADKRQAVEITSQIEADISSYLVTITGMNAAVGIATAIAMRFSGLDDPLLWGTTAFLLNYVPILGPLTGIVIFLLAGMLTIDGLGAAFLPAGLFALIHIVEGELVTPMLLARRFTVNPVLLILSLVFWYWMWGVPGAILAMPVLAVTKIVCDRVESLRPLGHFLEG